MAVIFALIGVGLVVRGVVGGVWPISVQLIAGVALIAYAVVRLRFS
jgi:hypothetical protein